MCVCTPNKRTPACETCPDDVQKQWRVGKYKDAPPPQKGKEGRVMQMKVSMDGLRRNLARSYSELVDHFNYLKKHDGVIDWEELEDMFLSLRQDIAVLHCVFTDDEEQFSDLSSEIEKNLADIHFSDSSHE